MAKTPTKNLTNGQRASLVRDCERSFDGYDVITVEGLFNWATETGTVYTHFWPRYVHSYVTKYTSTGRLASAAFSGLFNGLLNQSPLLASKLSYTVLYATAKEVHQHYLKMLRDVYPNVFIPGTVEELERHERRK